MDTRKDTQMLSEETASCTKERSKGTGLEVSVMVLTTLSTIFKLWRGGHFYWSRKPAEYPDVISSAPRHQRDSNSQF